MNVAPVPNPPPQLEGMNPPVLLLTRPTSTAVTESVMRRGVAYCLPVPTDPTAPEPVRGSEGLPGLTACSLCAGETLGSGDPLPGGQAERLRRLAETGAARLTFVECLDECERGDVVVARPSGHCRRAGAAPVWFERLAGAEATSALDSWLRAGGPGTSPLPPALTDRIIDRSSRADQHREVHIA